MKQFQTSFLATLSALLLLGCSMSVAQGVPDVSALKFTYWLKPQTGILWRQALFFCSQFYKE